MKITHILTVFISSVLLLLSESCKKKEIPVISIDKDTIFVNEEVRFAVNIDYKVKDEEWKVLELNESFSNVSAGPFKFPAKGVYTVQYSAETGLGKKIITQRKVLIYAAPGVVKNYWTGPNNARGDIFLRVKGTRYDGKPFADSIFYAKKYGVNNPISECADLLEPEVFLNVPGGRYQCLLKYKYLNFVNFYVEHTDSVFIDGNCEAFNY